MLLKSSGYFTAQELLEEFNIWLNKEGLSDQNINFLTESDWLKWRNYRQRKFKSMIYLCGGSAMPGQMIRNIKIII